MIRAGLIILAAAFVANATHAQVPRVPDSLAETELYRLVKVFDFDERPLGNYEDLPMNWERLSGPGLPFYSAGRFDDASGYKAAPSFMLEVQTGNVAYEYRHFDLTVVPQSDYLVEAYIRAEQLNHSRAFIASYLVDRFQDRIPGSESVSQVVGGNDQWRRVSIEVPGDHPDAYAMRIQLWILHTHAWRPPPRNAIDPIIRQDTHGRAWFDDIAVYRLPRARLRFSHPAGLVEPGAREGIVVEVNNATPQQLQGELELLTPDERLVHSQPLVVPGTVAARNDDPAAADRTARPLALTAESWHELRTLKLPLPDLEPGTYTARLRLRGGSDPLLVRRLRFAVLPELSSYGGGHPDLGIDLGPWRMADLEGVVAAVRALGIGATQIGVPMIGALNSVEKQSYYTQISELVRRLAEQRIDTVGVMLSQSAGLHGEGGAATVTELESPSVWRELASPILAHFGGMLNTWQLGADRIDLNARATWTPEKLAIVAEQVRQFITLPNLVLPRRATDEDAPPDLIVSRWLGPEIPAASFPRLLAFLLEDRERERWVRLDWPAARTLTNNDVADRARRLLLAKALGPDRLHVPAPFEVTHAGGAPRWQPTEDFIWLRTLCHALAGKKAIAAMHPRPEVVALVFDSPGSNSCLAIWSWRESEREPVELYLGDSPRAFDPFGRDVPLEVVEGRTRIPVGPMPILIESLQTPLVVLHASYSIRPQRVQIHTAEPRPVLRFKNPYNAPMSGEVIITPPENWTLEPDAITFSLEPGAWFEQPLTFRLPPRQLATGYPLRVDLILREPFSTTLVLHQELDVGLREIGLSATAYWSGDQLIVEQTLRNDSDRDVSFNAFCEPPGRGRFEGAFLDVAPGATMITSYVFPSARDLAGAVLHHGIGEISGPRRLDKVVEVPN